MGYPRNMDGTEGPRAELYPGLRSPGGGHRGAPARALGRTADHRGRPPYPCLRREKNARKRKKTVDAVAAS